MPATTRGRPPDPPDLPPGTVSWLEIDLAALAANVRAFQGRLGGARLAAVVKSEAYGHGVALVAPAALRAGASWLAVWGANEGIPLRALVGPDVPILCLGHTPPQDFADAVAADLRLTLYDPSAIPALARAARAQGRTARVHLKLETGTHRQGLEAEEAVALARAVAAEPEVLLEGISTHYADIEDTTDHGYAESQMARFTEGVDRVAAAGPASHGAPHRLLGRRHPLPPDPLRHGPRRHRPLRPVAVARDAGLGAGARALRLRARRR